MRITNGDLEITKNVLTELSKTLAKTFNKELSSGLYQYDLDCPSYFNYHALTDARVFIGKKIKERKSLTNG